MTFALDIAVLIEYTEWQREKWFSWLREHGDQVLQTPAGPHGDGRFETMGEVIRHIFSAELRYVDRLSGREVTDTSSIAADKVETLVELSQRSREALMELVENMPAEDWEKAEEYKMLNQSFILTPKKIVVHVLMHEVRHWAQIASLFRVQGLATELQDFLFSPLLQPAQEKKAAS